MKGSVVPSMSSLRLQSACGVSAEKQKVPHAGVSNEMSGNVFAELRNAFEQQRREVSFRVGSITKNFDSRLTGIEKAISGNFEIMRELSSKVADLSHWTKAAHGPSNSYASHASLMSHMDPAGTPLGKSQTSDVLSLLELIKQAQQDVSKLAQEFQSERELWRKSLPISNEKTPSSRHLDSNLGFLHSNIIMQTNREKQKRSLGDEASEDIFMALENFNVRAPQTQSANSQAEVKTQDALEDRINEICAQAQSVNDFYHEVTEGMYSAPMPHELGSCDDLQLLTANQTRVNPPPGSEMGNDKDHNATSRQSGDHCR